MALPDGEPPRFESAVNPLPPAVWLLFLAIIGVEAALTLGANGIVGGPGAVGWRLQAIRDYGFSAQVFQWMLEQHFWPREHLLRFVTYPFIHPVFTSTLFSCAMLLALGKWVGEIMGSLAVLVIFFAAAILGALLYGLLATEDFPLIGAFPPVYGLIGAFTWALWVRLRAYGQQQLRAFTLIGVLMGLQLLFGLIFGATQGWIADIGGFIAGFVLAPVLVPGGFRALVARLRREG